MEEETGYTRIYMKKIKNVTPFEETFIGSNYKCYRHKYYLMYVPFEHSLNEPNYEKSEVSCVRWCNFEEAMNIIRPYNGEKKEMIKNVHISLNKYKLIVE